MSDELTTEDTIYITYIASTAERVWDALTQSAFTTHYFFGRTVESDWKQGSEWILRMPDGRVDIRGVIREANPPRKLVVTWNVDWAEQKFPESIVSYEIEEARPGLIKLTMTEAHPTPIPRGMLEGGRNGWPMILSGLKSLLETGKPLPMPIPQPPKEMK